ncbi:hypothetical protein [Asticcacaulis sp. AND118]|uniref:hypothetical protein n=1 Tax=Asticcacaulis sp. AND118 TaxID=2840468 RepID=UPI001CFF8AC1|nr:hypothetical protein [Asticcacaulis sp. AND118]UDF02721.1 hypothetical protein LH365_09775 [Asticcacaulis sp. AND118]
MKLSIDFAFDGIEIIRKHPLAVALWGVVLVVIGFATSVLTVLVAGPAIARLQGMEQSPPDDPMAVFGSLGELAPVWLISFIVGMLASAIIQCAVFRSQLQPEARGLGFMRLGGAEIRQVFVTILWALAFLLFYILFIIVFGIIIAVINGVLQGGFIGGLISFVLIVVAFIAFLYVLGRWSLVMAQSYAEQKIDIFGSLKLTKGKGWVLLGGYLLLGLVICAIMFVIYGVLLVLTIGTGSDILSAMRQMSQPDMGSLEILLTPLFIFQTVLSGFLNAGFYAMVNGAALSAYRTLSDKGTKSVEVF